MRASDVAGEIAKTAPPVAAGALQLSGTVTLPDVVAAVTLVWLLVLIGEKAVKVYFWWIAGRAARKSAGA